MFLHRISEFRFFFKWTLRLSDSFKISLTLDAFVIEYGYKLGTKWSIPYILSSFNILSFSEFGKLCTPCRKFQSARKITFQNRLCEKFSLETLVQSMSQPHKISPLHFRNIREERSLIIRISQVVLDSIRFSLYSTQSDSVHFFKFRIRFDSIRMNRIESNRIIRQFDSLSVSATSELIHQI